MKVPFFDWAGLYNERATDFSNIISQTLGRGGFILQKDVEDFEAQLAQFVGTKYAVGLSDGTNAILLGLRASGISPGDEIIIAGHSFLAAAQSIHHAGAVPVAVEIDETDWLISVEAVNAAITPKTRAIMPVHVNGRVCQMDALLEIATRHNLDVYEDAAQALGARFGNIAAGKFGRWGTFSFYPSKTLGCFGDGGALVTDDEQIYKNVKAMRNHGANDNKLIPLDVKIWGTNARLDNIQAAILNYKFGYYNSAISRRRQIAQRYHETLIKFPDVRLPPPPNSNTKNFDVYQNYEFCHPLRDELRNYLAKHEIGTIIQWGGFGIHQLDGLGLKKSLPRTDRFFKESLLLPINHILLDWQIDYVCSTLESFFYSA